MSESGSETVAFRMILNHGQADEYRRRHDHIWPDLSAALVQAGVLDYRIFLDPESDTLLADLPRTEIMQRWWAMMADIMQTGPDHVPVQIDLLPMFHLSADDDRA